jgi:hypothetical protein
MELGGRPEARYGPYKRFDGYVFNRLHWDAREEIDGAEL